MAKLLNASCCHVRALFMLDRHFNFVSVKRHKDTLYVYAPITPFFFYRQFSQRYNDQDSPKKFPEFSLNIRKKKCNHHPIACYSVLSNKCIRVTVCLRTFVPIHHNMAIFFVPSF